MLKHRLLCAQIGLMLLALMGCTPTAVKVDSSPDKPVEGDGFITGKSGAWRYYL